MREQLDWSQSKIFLVDILSHCGDIRDQSRKLCKIAPNFACFWPTKFFRGGLPEILDLHYKIGANTDHRAKFCGDRANGAWRSRGEKKSRLKQKAFRNVPGGLITNTTVSSSEN